MLLESGERELDAERLRTRLSDAANPSYTLIAFSNGAAAGYVDVGTAPYARARATGHVVIGVAATHAGQGIGRALLVAAREQALIRGLRRLELTVMEHNRRALNLYLTCGYQIEGLRRDVLTVDGKPVSEYYMALLLAPA